MLLTIATKEMLAAHLLSCIWWPSDLQLWVPWSNLDNAQVCLGLQVPMCSCLISVLIFTVVVPVWTLIPPVFIINCEHRSVSQPFVWSPIYLQPIPQLDDEPLWMKRSTVCPVAAGSAIIRDPRAWHGGTPNLSNETRCMPNVEYYASWYRFRDHTQQMTTSMPREVCLVLMWYLLV